MAWFLVRERERELARRQRIKDAEQTRARARAQGAHVIALPARPPQSTRPPRGRRAA